MYVKVEAIPPNKTYIILRDTNGDMQKVPRQYGRHLRVGDICLVTEYRGRPQIKLLTDDDEVVIVGTTGQRQPEQTPPVPIQIPETII